MIWYETIVWNARTVIPHDQMERIEVKQGVLYVVVDAGAFPIQRLWHRDWITHEELVEFTIAKCSGDIFTAYIQCLAEEKNPYWDWHARRSMIPKHVERFYD